MEVTSANPGGSPGAVDLRKDRKDKRGKVAEGNVTTSSTSESIAAETASATGNAGRTAGAAGQGDAFLAMLGQSVIQSLFANMLQNGGAGASSPIPADVLASVQSRAPSVGPAAGGLAMPVALPVGAGLGLSNTTTPVRKTSRAQESLVLAQDKTTTAQINQLRDQVAVKSYLLAEEEAKRKAAEDEITKLKAELTAMKEEAESKQKKLKKQVKEKEDEMKKPIIVLAQCTPSVMSTAIRDCSSNDLRIIKTQYTAAITAIDKAKKDAKRREAKALKTARAGRWALSMPSIFGGVVGKAPSTLVGGSPRPGPDASS